MSSLKIFTPENGIYSGVNTPQFAQLEYLVTNNLKNPFHQFPHLGLFGEASTGKTTAVSLIANKINYKMIYINCSGLTVKTLNSTVIRELKQFPPFKDFYSREPYYVNQEGLYSLENKKVLLFFDEAHELSKQLQSSFLSFLEGRPVEDISNIPFIPEYDAKEPTFELSNFTFVFATTDTGKLSHPLLTRLNSVIFDQYSKDDIVNMLSLKHSNISEAAKGIIANCSKLVPRVAFRLSNQLIQSYSGVAEITEEHATSFAKTFLNMEENGVDSIDKRILLYLANHKKKIEPIDVISLEFNKKTRDRLEAKAALSTSEHRELNRSLFQITVLEQRINSAEFTPKSRQDISLACRILDLDDLETRLTFLEKLSLVTKSPKGIMLHEKYL